MRLLADAEYHVKLICFQHRRRGSVPLAQQTPRCNPLATPYAQSYRDLIRLADTDHIRLMLATTRWRPTTEPIQR